MKRLAALVLCIAMLMTLCVCATAEEEKKTFTFMIPANSEPSAEDPDNDMWYSLYQAFVAAYPEYDIEWQCGGVNSDDFNAAVQMAAAANNLANLTYTSFGYVDDWSNYGLTLNLADYLDEDFFALFVPGAVDMTNQYNTVEGVYGLPCRAETQGWAYNTALFEQCNLEIPTTWDEFMNCVKVFKENGILPISHGATDIWAIWGYHAMFCNDGLNYEEAQKLQNHEEKFAESASFRRTFERIAELAAAGAFPEDVATTSNDVAMSRFAAGEAAMYCMYDTVWKTLTGYKETGESDIVDHCVFNFGPSFADGVGEENFCGLRTYGWTFIPAVNTADDADALEAMLAFLKYFFSPEGTVIVSQYQVPATEFEVKDSAEMSMMEASIYASYLAEIVPVPDNNQAWFDQSIKPTYRNAVTGLICGTLSVDDALTMMQDWADTM